MTRRPDPIRAPARGDWSGLLVLLLAVAASVAVPQQATPCTLTTTGATTIHAGATFTLTLGATDTGDGLPTSWTISWGDGSIQTLTVPADLPATGGPVTHTYAARGIPSYFSYNILASAVCNGKSYFQSDLVVPSAVTDGLNWYRHDAATNEAVTRAPVTSGPDAGLDYPLDAIIGPDGNLYVSGLDSGNVVRYDPTTGAFIDQFATGGTSASGMAFGPDGHLYVGDATLRTVRRYDGSTGAFIDDFVTAGLGGITEPEGLTFGPDGHLYVSDFANDAVHRFHGSTGASLGVFTSGTAPRDPEDIIFGPDGNLYVASDRDHKVLRYDGTTGAYLGDFVLNRSGGLDNAQGVTFGPDGNLYVSSWQDDAVYRYDGSSGAFIDVYVSAGLGGLDTAEYFEFVPGHRVLVAAPQYDSLKSVTIDRSKIPGTCGATLADYPMLFNTTDPDLAHTGNGGAVTDTQGDDIIFKGLDDATCGGAGLSPCLLDHEIERYVGTTGELVAWVRIPSVNTAAAGSDTVIYIYYGNDAVTSPTENPTGVWDAGYKGVYHLEEDVTDEATSGTHDDSTSNGNDGVQNGNQKGIGQVADGQDFDGTDDYVDVGNVIGAANAATLSAWIKHDNLSAARDRYIELGNDVVIRHDGVSGVGQLHFYVRTGGIAHALRVNGALSNGLWYHVAGTWDGTTQRVFLNGVERASQVPGGSLGAFTGGHIGDEDPTEVMDGLIDEARISDVARSACWIAASYNNQVWPDKAVTPSPDPSPNPDSGFYTIGAATAVELVSFEAEGLDGSIALSWETGSELNNLGFQLYRSLSETGPWERITSAAIPGLGSSPEGARYAYRDTGLTNGVTYYYQLEDIETTGRTDTHGPVSATPSLGGGNGEDSEAAGHGGEASPSVIIYGKPEANRLRVLKRGRFRVVLELTTAGFVAHPEADGSVSIEIADFMEVDDRGLPLKRTWVAALAGRRVELVSVRERDVESLGLRPTGSNGQEIVAFGNGVVGLRRRPRRSSKLEVASDGARVVSVGFQGEDKKALVELAPLSWDASRQELRLAKKLFVTLSFQERDRDEIVGPDERRGRRPPRNERPDAGGVVARLATRMPGLHAVSYEELFGARYRGRGVDAARLRLSRLGETVPYHLEPASSSFAPGSTLYFVSPGADANPYGGEAVFELAYPASGGSRMAVRQTSPSGAVADTYWRRDAYEANHLYQAALMETEERWLWDTLFAPARKAYRFSVDALAAGEGARLELWLQGGSDVPGTPDHHVGVYVNGTLLGERSWDGKLPQNLEVELGLGVLREGENVLEIDNVGDTGAAYSVVFLDRYAITYPRFARMEAGILEGTWTDSGTAEVSGTSSRALLLDTTDAQPVWLTGASPEGDVRRFRAEAGRRYLVVDANRVEHPELRKASAPRSRSRSNQADYLVVGPRELLDAARPLLDHRRRQGLTALAVSTEEIFADFGFGESRPEAIRDFLRYAYHEWKGPSPRYVLLVGDATYDFKDYYGTGVKNRVPPLMLETRFVWTVSDPAYAAVNGEDLLPDMAIGRIPAASVDELRVMVEKILAYETGEASLRAPVVLVTDDPDSAGDFDADAEELAATVLAARAPERISLKALGTLPARQAVRDAFDDGASVISYMGHGGIHLWAGENLLDLASAASLSTQAQQPLLLTMNCLNGYFHFPFFNSLSEELVKAEGKGAIAAFSPSGMSLNAPAHRYHGVLLNELFHGGHRRLGDAVLSAQEAYAETGALPELLSIYHLLGDPALVLR